MVITHWHHDHTGGINDLLSQCPDASVYKHKPTAGQLDISDGQIFHTQGATLHAFHCPGHMVDHTAFVLEEEDAMFTGDNVLGQGTSVFEDLTAYLDSLSQMEKQFRGRAYPGHGSVISDGPGRIRDYIAHRKQREDEILQILRGAKPGNDTNNPATPESWTPRELVQVIYKDVPKELYDRAEKGVVQVLHKLQLEGRVVEVDNGRRCKIADTATNRVSL